MYICPICSKRFENDVIFTKHFLVCWKENHPNYKSKPAPRSEDINTSEINEEVANFFSSFK